MSTYDEILGTVSRIADAAIEWDMWDRGWTKSDNGWLSTMAVSPTATYELDATGMYVSILGDVAGELHHREEFAPTADIDFRAIWRDWYDRFYGVFEPWKYLPDPADFQPSLDAIADAVSVLNVNTTVSDAGASEDKKLETANADLDSALFSFCGEIVSMGGAMDSFALLYSNRLPGVIQGQLAVLGILGSTMAAEQNLFKELRADVARIADDVLEVMQAREHGGAATTLGVIGAVLSGASLFFTGGASAALIANGSAILGALGPFVPEDEADSPAQDKFGGSDPMEVYDNVERFLDELKKSVREEEEVVQSSLRDALNEVASVSPESFDLSRKPDLLSASNKEIKGTDVNPTTLAYIGGVLAPFIAENLKVARQRAEDAPNQPAWDRDGSIGVGASGPYSDWEKLHQELVDLVTGTKDTLEEVGDKLVAAAGQYVNAEQVVKDRMKELAGELEVPKF